MYNMQYENKTQITKKKKKWEEGEMAKGRNGNVIWAKWERAKWERAKWEDTIFSLTLCP
jgi:hypothetical protein